MNPSFWLGVLAFPVVVVLATAAASAFLAIWAWASWKRCQIRLRAEWTQENPYWREAFDAGAKWALEGDSRAEPNLTQLGMPDTVTAPSDFKGDNE